MNKHDTIRNQIIAALPRHGETPLSANLFIKALKCADMEEERAVWEVVGTMEKDGEVRLHQNQTLHLTQKVSV